NIPGIDTLEAFNSDGLRSLIFTIPAKNIKEKTLRYPGHIEKMSFLRDIGFFSKEEVEVSGRKVRPVDLTARLLFPKWQLQEGDRDVTVMMVSVKGIKNGKPLHYRWDLFDTYDAATKVHSMARTTGYTATTALRMITEGLYTKKGLSYPEYIGQYPECVDYMISGLKKHGVIYKASKE
ncbi:MAG: saccharopine dehydrogenase C-terminal domain-containing protein, partial [Bacteroidales bacterium]|nr:saccharopine dehydrogenase C-terminal domain-containing protein [Bacteroidales bacterium]